MIENGVVIDSKYKIIKKLGNGGMGTVYLAEHCLLGQKWAIKEIQKETKQKEGIIRQSLLAETNILKKLNHPNLPRIIDVIQTKETVLLVMDYVEGVTLEELIHIWGPQSEKQVIKWAKELCEVLLYLHTRNPPIIYCDLKPSNIMVKPDGNIMLIDFGTAREYCGCDIKGMICLGTECYAAPEQFLGKEKIDERTDIYSFGLVIWTLLIGSANSGKKCAIDTIEQKHQKVSNELKQIIRTCVQNDPLKRYADCFALKFALDRVEKNQLGHEENEKKKVIRFGILLMVLMICGCSSVGIRHVVDNSCNDLAISYINQAERAIEKDKILENYKLALQISPAERKIYDSIAKYFIQPEKFGIEQATSMMSLLESSYDGKNVLQVFCRKDPEGYSNFCYEVGIGYFYYMSGVTGKKEARIWFQEVKRINSPDFSVGKRKRADLYERICSYYDTFIENGGDCSGEREQHSFEDFYDTLHELNQIKIEKSSEKSDAAAAYLISKEIAIEIGNHALDFLKEQNISSHMLMKELSCIDGEREGQDDRISLLNPFFEKEEIEELRLFVKEAKKKVILAEQVRNQEED